jgi:hypothetical protein
MSTILKKEDRKECGSGRDNRVLSYIYVAPRYKICTLSEILGGVNIRLRRPVDFIQGRAEEAWATCGFRPGGVEWV